MTKLFVIFVCSTWLVHWLEFCNGQRHRVQGGTETKKHEFPFIVSLSEHDGQHRCGGTIIHEEWILTAAHCFDRLTLNQVAAGVYNTEVHDGTEQIVGIKVTKIYPDYKKNEYEHDIALVRVHPPFNLNGHVKVLPLSAKNAVASGYGTVIGWGYYGQGQILSTVLRKIKVPFQRNNMCKERYGTDFNKASMLCAGGQEADACDGDSGGPLICTNLMRSKRRMVTSTVRSNKPILCGIVSFGGDECVKDDTLGVYTKVSFYRDWIDKTMSGKVVRKYRQFYFTGERNHRRCRTTTVCSAADFCDPSLTTPLYRYYNKRTRDHFYTTAWNELRGGSNGYEYEGTEGRIFQKEEANTVALHRFYNPGNGDNLYTRHKEHIEVLTTPGTEGGYVHKGITGYVYPMEVDGSVELYRYYNFVTGDHFYTTNWNELGHGTELGKGYFREGISIPIFVCPSSSSSIHPI